MRRTIWFALMTALLLTGCGRAGEEESFARFRESLEGKEIRFTAEITSQGEADTVTFTGDVVRAGEETVLTVRSPETIRGVSVTMKGADRTLIYEDLVLALTPLRPDSLAPCAAGHLLLEAVLRGHVLWTEGGEDHHTAALFLSEDETVTLRRDAAGTPVYAEIARGERTELILRLSNWQIKE